MGSPLVSTPNFTSIYSAKDDMGFKLPRLNFSSTQNVSCIKSKIAPYDDSYEIIFMVCMNYDIFPNNGNLNSLPSN